MFFKLIIEVLKPILEVFESILDVFESIILNASQLLWDQMQISDVRFAWSANWTRLGKSYVRFADFRKSDEYANRLQQIYNCASNQRRNLFLLKTTDL